MLPNSNPNIIKPHNCVLGFGIPTSKQTFFDDQKNPDKDFAKRFNGVWSKYYHQFIQELEDVEPLLRLTGLNIIHELTLYEFSRLFESNQVVVLFSHWTTDAVEFSDGLKKIEHIVDQIPANYTGIVDLCICHPDNLAKLIRRKIPYGLVKYISNEATPLWWLHFYLLVFNHLKENDLTYLETLDDVISHLFKSINH